MMPSRPITQACHLPPHEAHEGEWYFFEGMTVGEAIIFPADGGRADGSGVFHASAWATDGTRESFDVREFVEPWPLSSDCLPPDGELSARATELQRAVKAWQEKSSLAVRYLDAGTLNGHVS